PLPRDWAQYKGLYHDGPREIIAYSVGATDVLESPGLVETAKGPVFTRTFNLRARPRALMLQVAKGPALQGAALLDDHTVVVLGDRDAVVVGVSPAFEGAGWHKYDDGTLRLEIPAGGRPLKFTLWTGRVARSSEAVALARALRIDEPARDLEPPTRAGGP